MRTTPDLALSVLATYVVGHEIVFSGSDAWHRCVHRAPQEREIVALRTKWRGIGMVVGQHHELIARIILTLDYCHSCL